MYAKINNSNVVLEYPVNIFTAHPNVSFPVGWTGGTVDGNKYVFVSSTSVPEVPHTQTVTEGTPSLTNGEWVQVWTTTAASAEVVAQRVSDKWAQVRQQRNGLLAACDWTQLADNQLSATVKTNWQTYRQALRDVTLQSNPFQLTWPTAP